MSKWESWLGMRVREWEIQKAVFITFTILLLSLLISTSIPGIQLNPAAYSFAYTDILTLIEYIGLFIGTLLLVVIFDAVLDRIKWHHVKMIQYLVMSVLIVVFVIIWFVFWYYGFIGPHAYASTKSLVYISNSTGNAVNVFAVGSKLQVSRFLGFNKPSFVSLNATGARLYVVNQGNWTTSVVNTQNGQIISTLQGTRQYSPEPWSWLAYIILFGAIYLSAKLLS